MAPHFTRLSATDALKLALKLALAMRRNVLDVHRSQGCT
jgi:hypothetical protein